jgi:hypothetical protein
MRVAEMLGIVVGAAVLTAAPMSIEPSAKSVVQVSLNKAHARYAVYRMSYRRAYRRAFRRSYHAYGIGRVYYGYSHPSYGGRDGNGYSAYSAGYVPLGINQYNWFGLGGWR